LKQPPNLRTRTAKFIKACERRQSYFPGRGTFRAINLEYSILGPDIWNNSEHPKLWLYNLHYFDDLQASNASGRISEHTEFVLRWIAENPPGKGNGWEPYPLSLRIVNWIKWQLTGGLLNKTMLYSLGIQCRYLAAAPEYHLLANHLFANAKALVFAGLFFEGPEAEKWLQQGRDILSNAIGEQILADGGHCELSPMYHAIITEDLLDLINIANAFSWDSALPLTIKAQVMLQWLSALVDESDRVALFNDSAYGSACGYPALESYAERLGIVFARPDAPLVWLDASGYARVRRHRYLLFADLGALGPTYNPGHGHCDMLSFELVVDGARTVVDTGVSTYEANTRRLTERGTAAHNTVQINAMEQSDIWGAFRVGRRANISGVAVAENCLEASHNGYRRAGVIHHRRFIPRDDALVIEDNCIGAEVRATARLHVHPQIPVRREGAKIVAGPIGIRFAGADRVELIPYLYAPEFNILEPSICITIEFTKRLRTIIEL